MTTPFKPFATTLRHKGVATKVVVAFTAFDAVFVAEVKALGARFVDAKEGKGWYVLAESDQVEAFKAACAAARARQAEKAAAKPAAEPKGLPVNSDNLAHHMYDRNGALFG